ncbi:unnamed protein product [Caenorhabditis auriculariae]|uniref:NF-kappa-B-activating protein C-terminal domain-containing protein n=1 Tax=Caenorhabditis auriculariae TaxID=2777116 RepID=A0A8S1HJW0_9PELO|nr:unnamed protein product [Caenorhabditis auriculariae]
MSYGLRATHTCHLLQIETVLDVDDKESEVAQLLPVPRLNQMPHLNLLKIARCGVIRADLQVRRIEDGVVLHLEAFLPEESSPLKSARKRSPLRSSPPRRNLSPRRSPARRRSPAGRSRRSPPRRRTERQRTPSFQDDRSPSPAEYRKRSPDRRNERKRGWGRSPTNNDEPVWERRRESRIDIQWKGERQIWGSSPSHSDIADVYKLYEQADQIDKERAMEGAKLKAVREKERRKEQRKRAADFSDGSESEDSSDEDKKKKKKKAKKVKKEKKKKEKKKVEESSDEWEERAPNGQDEDSGEQSPGPAIPSHIKAKNDSENHAFEIPTEARYGKDLLAGEGAGMAAYVARGERIPRRGEIGLSSSEIEQYEKWGYVMSGSRHKAMEATRLRKENQILTAEEKRLLSGVSQDAKKKKEEAILDQFKQLIKNKNNVIHSWHPPNGSAFCGGDVVNGTPFTTPATSSFLFCGWRLLAKLSVENNTRPGLPLTHSTLMRVSRHRTTSSSPTTSEAPNVSVRLQAVLLPAQLAGIGFFLFSAVGLAAAAVHHSSPAPKPFLLRQGCPPDLLHSRALRAVQVACRTHPSTVVSAFEGIQDALGHCASRLRFQQWDCSEAGNIMHDPPLLRSGYRESALVWALSSAGAAWGVAASCAQGWIEDCACTPSGQPGFEFGGCTFGVQHGVTASRKLLTKAGSSNSLLRKVEKHNLKAGRLAVKKTLISTCKCHGVSGSCQQKTCWKRTAQLNYIADYLVEKYARARLLTDEGSIKSGDLVYLEASPDVCKSKTTAGRVCAWRNETHTQGDCDRLCCGNGFSIRHEVVRVKCDCQFVWCCNLVCKDCIQHRWISTCNGEPPKSLIF